MYVMHAIHDATEMVWTPVVTFMSKVTGKASVDLAMPAFRAGVLMRYLGAYVYIGEAVFGDASMPLAALHFFVVIFISWFLLRMMKEAVECAKRSENDGVVYYCYADRNLIVWRCLSIPFLAINLMPVSDWLFSDGSPHGIFEGLGWLLQGFGLWAVWISTPGGKSVFARAKERLKAMLQRPVLVPAPAVG